MNFAEGCGKVAIDTHLEGHTRYARHRGAHAARIAGCDENGGKHAEKSDTQRNRADGDGLKDAALGVDVGGGSECQDGKGSSDIHESDEGACTEDRAGQSTARVVDLFAHGRDELEAGKCKGDLRPEVHCVPVPRGHHVGQGEMRDGAVARANYDCHDDQNQQGRIGSYATGVLQPFADVKADDVERDGENQQCERDPEQERSVLSEGCAVA